MINKLNFFFKLISNLIIFFLNNSFSLDNNFFINNNFFIY